MAVCRWWVFLFCFVFFLNFVLYCTILLNCYCHLRLSLHYFILCCTVLIDITKTATLLLLICYFVVCQRFTVTETYTLLKKKTCVSYLRLFRCNKIVFLGVVLLRISVTSVLQKLCREIQKISQLEMALVDALVSILACLVLFPQLPLPLLYPRKAPLYWCMR